MRKNERMMEREFFLVVICCYSLIHVALSSDNFPGDNERELLIKHEDVGNTSGYFGSRNNLKEASVSNYERRQSRPLSAHFMYYKQQPEINERKVTEEISKQWFDNHSGNYNKERRNVNDLKQSLANTGAKSQDRSPKENLHSRNICISSSNGYRQRCLRKIKRKRLNIPLINTSKKKYFGGSLGTKENNLSLNVPRNSSNVFNITVDLNNHRVSRNFGTLKTMFVKDEKGSIEDASSPCTCYWQLDRCGCDCTGSLNYDDFQEVAKGFFPCRNFSFTMTDGQHYALPPNFFSNLKRIEIFHLSISNSSFEYICDPTPMTSAFKGVKFAISATISLTNVSVRRGWNWRPFEQLQSSSGGQVNIILEDCKLRRLTSDFSNLARGCVDSININNSNLEMVASNAFGTFENMTHFRVPDNKIKDLRRTDFPEILPKLMEIDLRNNKLSNLDDDLFKNMPFLREIFLSGNPLIVLSEKTFRDVIGRAKLAGISDISLSCDCHLRWLKDSKLSNNAVSQRNMDGAICRRPAYLRGTPLKYLSKEHLTCF